MNSTFVNYAHRGASSYAPENTLSAFYLGLRMEADGIETDIRRTKDGVLVLFHDDTLERVAGVKGGVGDYTLEELKQVMIFGKEGFTPDHIVTLEEFLYLFGYRNLTFAIEIKEQGVEADTVEMVRKFGILDKCIFTSFDYEAMKALRRADGGITLGYLFKEPVQGRINEAKAIDCRQLCVYGPCLNEKNAGELKAMGFSIRAWGIADEAAMRHAAALADGGMTVNFPDKLTTYRKELGI